jgi:hypothetical protein
MSAGHRGFPVWNSFRVLIVLTALFSQEKPAPIPERPKEKNTPHVPDFVRNVMGSSAGAGSGEFHVYRHLRRKEYARQKFIQEKGEKVHNNIFQFLVSVWGSVEI